MAKTTKRITGDYDIITDDGTSGTILLDTQTVTINGNLNVVGTQTTVSTTDTSITDNTIVLNDGESGAGVTAGSAGLDIDRGTADNATFQFNETDDAFEAKVGASFAVTRGGTPVGGDDLATKSYVDSSVGGASADKIVEGDSEAEIFDDGVGTSNFHVTLDGSDVLTVTPTSLSYANVSVNGNTISNTATDENLFLSTTGTGELELNSVVTMAEQASDPSAEANKTKLYAKVPGGGGSGIYTTTQNGSDELTSRGKAIIFGLIF
tara:strand:- start:3899 stop:4693 length:795 start_codon:yes stop_codon:yes gene_type:complete